MLSCVHALEAEYGVSFSNTRINCIIDDIWVLNFSPSDRRLMYLCYVCGAKQVLKLDNILPLLKERSLKGAATRNLGLNLVDDYTVYSATEHGVNLIIWAVDC